VVPTTAVLSNLRGSCCPLPSCPPLSLEVAASSDKADPSSSSSPPCQPDTVCQQTVEDLRATIRTLLLSSSSDLTACLALKKETEATMVRREKEMADLKTENRAHSATESRLEQETAKLRQENLDKAETVSRLEQEMVGLRRDNLNQAEETSKLASEVSRLEAENLALRKGLAATTRPCPLPHPPPPPVVPVVAPVVPEMAPAVPEAAPVEPKTAPVVPEMAPVVPEATPVEPKTAPVVPEKKPTTKEKVTVSEEEEDTSYLHIQTQALAGFSGILSLLLLATLAGCLHLLRSRRTGQRSPNMELAEFNPENLNGSDVRDMAELELGLNDLAEAVATEMETQIKRRAETTESPSSSSTPQQTTPVHVQMEKYQEGHKSFFQRLRFLRR
jgi:hypothetical protein